MAQLANCPQCDHDLLVPEGVAAGAWARCPSCRAFFQLKDAKSRELSTLELVESAGDADLAKHDADKTQDLASLATWTANEKYNELSLADESDSAEAEYSLAGESKTGETEGLDFAYL